MLIELDPVDRITADAIGDPGSRTFYLQARRGDRVVTLIVEKRHVELLAASIVKILTDIGGEAGEILPEEQMRLDAPVEPEFRATRLEIGYHEDRDLFLLEVAEASPAEDEDLEAAIAEELAIAGLEAPPGSEREQADPAVPEAGEETRSVARFWATRQQMLSLARHGAAVCAAGRPLCQLCGNPMDPDGHVCPALNGHAATSNR